QFGDLIEFAYPIGYSHWGVYDEDGFVVHFAVADQGTLMTKVSSYLQAAFPLCGDLLLGQTKIRRVPLDQVTVPHGAHILVSNNRHSGKPSSAEQMRKRRDALLDKQFGYKLLTFNCEHFATFVRYGRAVCNQLPGRAKNKECEEATEKFEELVDTDSITRELFR
ncbi:hypothetical protein CRUP_022906, partial [Coryphaenoides rupestris]